MFVLPCPLLVPLLVAAIAPPAKLARERAPDAAPLTLAAEAGRSEVEPRMPGPVPQAEPSAPEPGQKPPAKPGRPAPAAKPAPPAAPAPSAPPGEEGAPASSPCSRGERVNVRIDLKIRAQKESAVTVEKTLSLVTVGDNSRTQIRGGGSVPFKVGSGSGISYQSLALNADARALVEGRRISVELTLDFAFVTQVPEGEGRAAGNVTSSVQNVVRALLEDGKPLLVSEQADAATDYRVTVEAKATVLR